MAGATKSAIVIRSPWRRRSATVGESGGWPKPPSMTRAVLMGPSRLATLVCRLCRKLCSISAGTREGRAYDKTDDVTPDRIDARRGKPAGRARGDRRGARARQDGVRQFL